MRPRGQARQEGRLCATLLGKRGGAGAPRGSAPVLAASACLSPLEMGRPHQFHRPPMTADLVETMHQAEMPQRQRGEKNLSPAPLFA